ncbi:IS66 family transposase [Thermanaeromonas sp.]
MCEPLWRRNVDGYAGYRELTHVTLVGCWAHA